MTPDLVIKGGTVVDGSGRPPFEADVVVHGDRIVAIGRHQGPAGEIMDARGQLVTPGFIDIHTHLDAQITWDPIGAPLSSHGVTSAVVGNCGVGFAPCKPSDREYLMYLMEGVEDIPAASMKAGMPWRWETFRQYLEFLDGQPLGMNIGAHVTHAPVRIFAMGERGALDTPPSDAELAVMRAAVHDAIAAGALGFSTGRTTMHRTPAGDAFPGTFADRRELEALIAPLAELGAGIWQILPYGGGGEDGDGFVRDLAVLTPIARQLGRPASIALTAPRRYPDRWQESLERVTAAIATGARFVPQVATRCIGVLLSMAGNMSPLFLFPEAGDLIGRPLDEVRAALSNPEVRRRVAASLDPNGELLAGMATVDNLFVLDRAGVGSYETSAARSVVGLAAERGCSVGEVVVDALFASDLQGLLMLALYNVDMATSRALITHPLTLPGLGDAGAHTSQTCDVGVGTFTLAYWVRDQQAMSVETAVRKLTFDQALAWGIPGRGLVRTGWKADLNVIDLPRLDLEMAEMRHDLPGGAPNLSQRARGYSATIVNGKVFMRNGQHTGAFAGRVLRNEVAAANG
jgi:N-acyl-D-amino-acid deacylase